MIFKIFVDLAMEGRASDILELLKTGLYIDKKDGPEPFSNFTAAGYLAFQGQFEAADILQQFHANIDEIAIGATMGKHLNYCQNLIEYGADINVVLKTAASTRQFDYCNQLLNQGADIQWMIEGVKELILIDVEQLLLAELYYPAKAQQIQQGKSNDHSGLNGLASYISHLKNDQAELERYKEELEKNRAGLENPTEHQIDLKKSTESDTQVLEAQSETASALFVKNNVLRPNLVSKKYGTQHFFSKSTANRSSENCEDINAVSLPGINAL